MVHRLCCSLSIIKTLKAIQNMKKFINKRMINQSVRQQIYFSRKKQHIYVVHRLCCSLSIIKTLKDIQNMKRFINKHKIHQKWY